MPKTQQRTPPPRNLAHIKRDEGYRFVERDPILAELCGEITDSGMSAVEIERRSGVCRSTILAWLSGQTRRPPKFNGRIRA
jgi:hypothetical protein